MRIPDLEGGGLGFNIVAGRIEVEGFEWPKRIVLDGQVDKRRKAVRWMLTTD